MKKIVLSLFVVGLMFTGFSVNAMGREVHLVGKDGVVNNQLKYTQTLRRGTKNANVLALQKKLKEFGFYHKALDSDYGSGTIAAVKQFQRAKGLKVDGIAGPKTFAMVLATDASALGVIPTKPILGDMACTKEYAPVCAEMEVNCIKAPCHQPKKTFSNSCMAGLAKAKVLYKGKCQTTKPIDIDFNDLGKKCLDIKPAENLNKKLSVGNNNKIISEFIIKNNCSRSVKIHHLGFSVISSYSAPQFNNIKVFVGDDYSNLGILSVNSSNDFNGDYLGFDYNKSDISNLETIRPNHDIEVAVRADINGLSSFNGSNFSSAFSVGLIDANYTLDNGNQYREDNLDVYGPVVIVNHNS